MSVAFSTDTTDQIIRQEKQVCREELSREALKETYDVEKTVSWIRENGYKRVALQFSDEILHCSSSLAKILEERTEKLVFILADTSYGSCCVDEVAAEHYSADCLVHYGPSCLSPTTRLPVLYVFPKEPIDPELCCSKLKALPDLPSKLILMYDVCFYHTLANLEVKLMQEFPNIVISELMIPNNVSRTDGTDVNSASVTRVICHCGRRIQLSFALEDYAIVYLGKESLELTNLMMTFNKNQFYSFNPFTSEARKETANVNKMLMKRYFMVEKAKEANIVGIVAGTLGVTNYLDVINRLKLLLQKVGKKVYTFVVGKLNVPKLANFMEVDIFVVVACPLNSLLDSKEFYKPVITPYEMEVACTRQWTGNYVTDFRELLPGGEAYEPLPDGNIDQSVDVSLITGGIRTMGTSAESERTDSGDQLVEQRPEALSITSVQAKSGEEYLHQRSWQGLEQKMGQTAVSKAVEGTKGIAMGYDKEPLA